MLGPDVLSSPFYTAGTAADKTPIRKWISLLEWSQIIFNQYNSFHSDVAKN